MTMNMKSKKGNFKSFERIVKETIKEAKRYYYFKTFTAHKNDLRNIGEQLTIL